MENASSPKAGELVNIAQPEKLPKVSVCVITYNQEKYIRECLQSIIDQETNFEFEVIVGDDCSTDDTPAIVQEFVERYPNLIRLISQKKNTGGCVNYLTVHKAATGEYVAHIDGDDAMLPNKLQCQTTFMDKHLQCPATFHLMEIIDEKSNRTGKYWLRESYCNQMTIQDILLGHPNIGHSSIMYRKLLLKDYLTNLKSEFIDLHIYLAIAKIGPLMSINETLGLYRIAVGMSAKEKVLDLVFDAVNSLNDAELNTKIINAAGYRFATSFSKITLANKKQESFIKYWDFRIAYNENYNVFDSIIKKIARNRLTFVLISNNYIAFLEIKIFIKYILVRSSNEKKGSNQN
jgi:glycosyltransferase involved in cell wall biosynthesis